LWSRLASLRFASLRFGLTLPLPLLLFHPFHLLHLHLQLDHLRGVLPQAPFPNRLGVVLELDFTPSQNAAGQVFADSAPPLVPYQGWNFRHWVVVQVDNLNVFELLHARGQVLQVVLEQVQFGEGLHVSEIARQVVDLVVDQEQGPKVRELANATREANEPVERTVQIGQRDQVRQRRGEGSKQILRRAKILTIFSGAMLLLANYFALIVLSPSLTLLKSTRMRFFREQTPAGIAASLFCVGQKLSIHRHLIPSGSSSMRLLSSSIWLKFTNLRRAKKVRRG